MSKLSEKMLLSPSIMTESLLEPSYENLSKTKSKIQAIDVPKELHNESEVKALRDKISKRIDLHN